MSPRAYAVRKAEIHTSAHQPHPLSPLQTTLYSCSAERIPVRGADTKTEHVGSGDIISVEERWGSSRYKDWSSISHQDLQNHRERIEGEWLSQVKRAEQLVSLSVLNGRLSAPKKTQTNQISQSFTVTNETTCRLLDTSPCIHAIVTERQWLATYVI